MRNWELMNLLSKLPAGAEVKFKSVFEDVELKLSDSEEILIDREITDVSLQDDKILLC